MTTHTYVLEKRKIIFNRLGRVMRRVNRLVEYGVVAWHDYICGHEYSFLGHVVSVCIHVSDTIRNVSPSPLPPHMMGEHPPV